MSIQINKKEACTVSIKNRYKHTVENPDATYGNNLDRIIPGLTDSFSKLLRKEYILKLNDRSEEKFSIPGYKLANDGKYYKYNEEINGTYYCLGNIVIKQGEIIKVANPDEELLVDYFRINKKDRSLFRYRGFICWWFTRNRKNRGSQIKKGKQIRRSS